ncbi:hypothetical protein FAZ69_13250 [Trinickia terrae]|uniref:Uncharacterized protein n=1 Tax=Trinickia terrae TaxID=2571161 RepID=A0A4U1I5T3_9BURK|nr:hypothetical protein [Trinickia terrae]TKC88714.1 hypothetical protein FAZ69_13250 [Trinickia terrae]
MFNSTVLEVGIGIIFCFCAVSLIVSSINEAIASAFQLRGKYLLQGIKDLLNDPNLDGLALDIYNHALFNPNSSGDAGGQADLTSKPAYVPPRQFALALVDILQTNIPDAGDLAGAIQSVPDPQLRQMLQGLYQRAAGETAQFETEIAAWYDSAMQHVSGDYKRTLQFWTVLFGLAVAMLMNIDALHLFKVLWMHPALVQGLASDQLASASSAWNQLSISGLPIGWDAAPFDYKNGKLALHYSSDQLLAMSAGWLITASSTLFGAPFWFDLLRKAGDLFGGGRRAA